MSWVCWHCNGGKQMNEVKTLQKCTKRETERERERERYSECWTGKRNRQVGEEHTHTHTHTHTHARTHAQERKPKHSSSASKSPQHLTNTRHHTDFKFYLPFLCCGRVKFRSARRLLYRWRCRCLASFLLNDFDQFLPDIVNVSKAFFREK